MWLLRGHARHAAERGVFSLSSILDKHDQLCGPFVSDFVTTNVCGGHSHFTPRPSPPLTVSDAVQVLLVVGALVVVVVNALLKLLLRGALLVMTHMLLEVTYV